MNGIPEWLPTAAICVVIAVICVVAVKSYAKKLSKGCCGAAADDEAELKAAEGDYPYSCTVEIGGMTCRKCAQRIQNAFNRQEGYSAQVSLEESCAVIRCAFPIKELLIRKTMIDLGYSVGKLTLHN